MLKRPNLASVNCRSFRFDFRVSLLSEIVRDFVRQTDDIVEVGGRVSALFGNLYKSGNRTFVAEGIIHDVDADEERGLGDYHIVLALSRQDRLPPPKGLAKTQKLIAFLLEQSPDVQIECRCRAAFSYYAADGWGSIVDLPEKLSESWGEVPFTHVDSIRLSQRNGEESEQWIQITVTADGSIEHQTQFTRKETLSKGLAHRLLKHATIMSKQLVFEVRNEEEFNDTAAREI